MNDRLKMGNMGKRNTLGGRDREKKCNHIESKRWTGLSVEEKGGNSGDSHD